MPIAPRFLALAASLALLPSAPTLAQYCTAGASACTPGNADEYISRVVFNTIHNLTAGSPACYSDFTAGGISTTVEPGSAYSITVNNPNGYPGDQCVAWLDLNADGTFGDVASGEQFYLATNATNNIYTGLIPIPSNATLGPTRLRVRIQFTGNVSPCGATLFGEVEDYAVTIVAPTLGACCDPSGPCTMTVPAACTAPSFFQGIGNGCIPSNPCGGACCDSVGNCTVTLATGCAAGSGNTFVSHGSCTPQACRYCDAASNACSAGNADERISNVAFASINNPSGAGDGSPGCYGDFTFFTTDLLPGQSYMITVTNPSAFAEDAAAVWFDWNRDFAFGTAGSNEEFPLTSDGSGGSFTGMITVPAAALHGATRMRIRLLYNATPLPCGSAAYGEVEDYTVNVTGTGTCCVGQSCTFTTLDGCAGGIYTDGGSCTPNPCTPSGVCCRGSTCNASITNPALCAISVTGNNAGASFTTASNTCNTPANTNSPCCLTDYNKLDGTGVQDIFDFLNDWFAGSKFAVFRGDGLTGTPAVQDIFDYLNAWFAAGC